MSLGVVSGHFLSNDLFFEKLIRVYQIATPEHAYQFVIENIKPPPKGFPAIYGLSARYMLTKRQYLYCDEGAIVLANIVHKLGYRTQLVDLIWSQDNLSHHRILEVFQNGKWKTYDTLGRSVGNTYQECAGYDTFPRYRPYPRFYHSLMRRNFYLRRFVSLWRGVPRLSLRERYSQDMELKIGNRSLFHDPRFLNDTTYSGLEGDSAHPF